MSGEQQLERSVLEAKERDELHTIAEALSLKPATRTKKADLIDQILRATGVDVPTADSAGADAPEKPRPPGTRRPRAAAAAPADVEAGAEGDSNGAEPVASENGSAPEVTASTPEPVAAESG